MIGPDSTAKRSRVGSEDPLFIGHEQHVHHPRGLKGGQLIGDLPPYLVEFLDALERRSRLHQNVDERSSLAPDFHHPDLRPAHRQGARHRLDSGAYRLLGRLRRRSQSGPGSSPSHRHARDLAAHPAGDENCNSTWLNGRPLLDDLTDRLGQRIRIANDADCFALSEASTGAGVACSSVFGAILGTGVGGGLVIDGALVSGPNGLAGEWGHTPLAYLGFHGFHGQAIEGSDMRQGQVEPNALESRLRLRECYCGRQGCTETYLSGPGLQRTYRELWGEDRTTESIAGGSDDRAQRTSALYARMLARSLAQIINVIDPEVIVLGGGLSNIHGIYAPVNTMLADYVFSGECVTVVKPPRWGSESGVLGAAQLWPDDAGR